MSPRLNETIPARRSAGGPYSLMSGTSARRLERVHGELVLVPLDRLEPDLVDVVDRRAEPDRLGDRLRARLVLRGHLAPGRLLERDLADHVPAEVERLHRLEQLEPAPQRADARRPAHLVRREREEVAAERLDVDRLVRRRLRPVDDHDRALLVRPGRELLDRVDRPERVRDEVVRDHLDPALSSRSSPDRTGPARRCRRARSSSASRRCARRCTARARSSSGARAP